MGVRGREKEKPSDDKITIEVRLINETDKAVFVDSDGDRIWFPKSQVEIQRFDLDKTQDKINLRIPRWLYRDKFPNDPV